jgi:heme oxygenase (mycobilin-producing)
VLVVSRFTVAEEQGGGFADRARVALEAFAARPGFRRGWAGRSVDEPAGWVLVTEWDGVGAYRRALSAYEVKVGATPLLAQARDEPGAFEVLVAADGPGAVVTAASDRAADAATAGPERSRPGAAGSRPGQPRTEEGQ